MTKTEEIKLQQHQIKSLCEENQSLRDMIGKLQGEVATWSHRALDEQRRSACECSSLRTEILLHNANVEPPRERKANAQ
jgi:hypothetical protein